MNTPLWTDEYISIAIEDSGIADEDWLPVELMLKAMRDEYEEALVTRAGAAAEVRRTIREALNIADAFAKPPLSERIYDVRVWLDTQKGD